MGGQVLFHYIDEGADIFPRCILHTLSGLKVLNQRGSLRASYNPLPEGTRVVCKTYSITLDATIILLMCFNDAELVDGGKW